MSQEWQPIETAPRDGTVILCYGDGLITKRPRVVHWDSHARIWRMGWTIWFHADTFTHWMPLPAPPGAAHE